MRTSCFSMGHVLGAALVLLSLLLAGCGSTLFRSDFDKTMVGQPPAPTQGIGTAQIHGSAGSVIVVAPPAEPSGQWVRIGRPVPDTDVAGFQGNFLESKGDGQYTFTTTVFMPSGSGLATIQFERFGQPVSNLESFLHLDLTEDNRVRIDDDDNTKFGQFTRDQPFLVQVTLNIGEGSSNAHITLGGNANGEADHQIGPGLQLMARQFGAVRLWMGFPHTGHFDATNIVVKYKE